MDTSDIERLIHALNQCKVNPDTPDKLLSVNEFNSLITAVVRFLKSIK